MITSITTITTEFHYYIITYCSNYCHLVADSIRHAPRRETSSSPRHEGASPPFTPGGGSCLKQQMCVRAAREELVMGSPVGDVMDMEGGEIARQEASR